jgi:hypothetical protein
MDWVIKASSLIVEQISVAEQMRENEALRDFEYDPIKV